MRHDARGGRQAVFDIFCPFEQIADVETCQFGDILAVDKK